MVTLERRCWQLGMQPSILFDLLQDFISIVLFPNVYVEDAKVFSWSVTFAGIPHPLPSLLEILFLVNACMYGADYDVV
jgi:hypothetical protein